ncbi:cytochrome c oxidase subunit 4 [Dactylosporangium sp. NPDC000555]|uniref:aa3-type cytochrome oxidase subunit IV n=1 Tax=Dactylosporangium sp. NPDC000555 TaxID=3154260 RepID=UPI003323D660
MRTEARFFGLLAAVMLTFTIVYWVMTAALMGHAERVGIVALGLTTALLTLIGGDCLLIARRIPPRPEDRLDATPADGAGDVGFFSPFSYWPASIGLGAGVFALGVALWQLWLAGAGLLLAVASAAAMLFEYYTGTSRGES